MKDRIIEQLKQNKGKIGFYYKNLFTGEVIQYNEALPMMAASVIKLFVMAEGFRQFEEGIRNKEDPVTIRREKCVPSRGAVRYMHDGIEVTLLDLITLMIILSDNSATNYLIDILGADNINKNIRAMGFENVVLNRKMYEIEKSSRGIQNYITAGEVGRFLEMLYKGEVVSEKASAEMLEIMKEQQIDHKIPYILMTREDCPVIAHKTGEDDGITHDVGVVYSKQPFVVAFCGNETYVPNYELTMAKITEELFDLNN